MAIIPLAPAYTVIKNEGASEVPTVAKRKSLLSPRVPQDPELERYHPDLEDELRDVLADMHHNEAMFNIEMEPALVEQRIYERQALRCRYRYLLEQARKLGLHTILGAADAQGV